MIRRTGFGWIILVVYVKISGFGWVNISLTDILSFSASVETPAQIYSILFKARLGSSIILLSFSETYCSSWILDFIKHQIFRTSNTIYLYKVDWVHWSWQGCIFSEIPPLGGGVVDQLERGGGGMKRESVFHTFRYFLPKNKFIFH